MDKDLNILLENSMLTGETVINLSKGRKSLNEIESKLNDLLNS
jgi:hypothetical protein